MVNVEASTDNTVSVSEITFAGYANNEKGKAFDANKLAELYGKLLGTTNKANMTYANVAGLGTKTAADIRSNNNGKDVLVTFGGLQWTVTYLTQDSGNVVLDLWLASASETSTWSDGWFYQQSQSWTYPTNMYGSSYIRAVTLNNGGFYTYGGPDGITTSGRYSGGGYDVTSESQIKTTTATQSAAHKFSKFTMSGVSGSLADYILTPAQVSYQATESYVASLGGSYDNCNDAYTQSSKLPTGYNYWGKDHYTDWMNDKIWLPSLTETGTGDAVNGMWKLSLNQKRNIIDTWTRSAQHNEHSEGGAPHKITASGVYSISSNAANEEFAVRPALHLNLTAAEDAKAELLPTPQDIDAGTYDGTSKWIDSLGSDTPDWVNLDIHNNTDYMTLDVEYTNAKGELKTDKTYTTADIKDAGSYKITMKLVDGYAWEGGSAADKSFKITIAQKAIDSFAPTVDYGKNQDNSTKQYYPGTTSANFPTIKSPTAWDGKGTLAWDNNQTLSTTKLYNWTFTPDDQNFAVKKGTLSITVTPIEVKKIEATLTGTGDIFTSTKKEDLLKRIQVTKTNNDGTSAGIAATSEIQFATGTTLTAGTNKVLTVQLVGKTSVSCTVTIPEILAVTPAELSVEHDGTTVYTSTSADALKGQLTVKIINNDGSAGKTLEASEFSFPSDFAITDGDFKIEVIYKYTVNDEEKTLTGDTTITVAVAGIDKVTIKEVNVPAGTKLWEGDAANTIKQYLTVEVTYLDGNGTKKTLDASDNFTIKVTPANDKNVLIAGQCAFNVIYGGKTSTNVKTVTVSAVLVDTLTPNYTQTGIIYSSAKVEDLNIDTLLSVDAIFNNGDEDTLDKDSYTVTIPDNFSSANNEITVTWKKGDVTKTATFTVTVTDVEINGITAAYTLPDGFKLDASKGLEDLNGGLEVVLSYNNGDTKTLSTEGYTLTADSTHGDGLLSAGQRTITVTYSDGKTATFTVNVAKANADMSEVEFKDLTAAYDGKEHTLTISGTLPNGVTVEYEVKNQSGKSFTEIGTYEFTAKFTVEDTDNYNTIGNKTATLTITDASILGITAKAANDKFTTVNTLDDLKKVLTVTVKTTGGDEATEDYELSCEGLRDGGMFKFGLQKITVKYVDEEGNEFNTFVEIGVEKEKVAVPTFKGGLSYTGVTVKPTVENFNGYDGALMTFVTDKLQSGTVVGTYKAVFALKDAENYEWATATTYKKSVFAAVV
ncbi:MAG: hypothetical protein K2N22_04950, partial [Clostridia bacterium]|nr:hypothetical protein [Clostridia bacterium]